MNSKTDDNNNQETRSYATEASARQGWADLGHKGNFSASGGESNGTGGEYEIDFQRKEKKK